LYVLGINAHHADASAALLMNGKLVAAIEEERLRRVKHWAGFPSESIAFCLKEAGISMDEVNKIAIARDPKAKLMKKAIFLMAHPHALNFAVRGRLNNAEKLGSVESMLETMAGPSDADKVADKIEFIEHHRSHLASAFYASGLDEAALLSIDGSGDFTTTMMGVGSQLDMNILQSIDFPHSLGIFYTAFTQFLGFPHYGDEYKVMGLSPYGKPQYVDDMRKIVLWQSDGTFSLQEDWFRRPEKGYVSYDENHIPQIPILYSPQLEARFGKARKPGEPITDLHRDLASSAQRMVEETIFFLLKNLHEKTRLNALCLSGGVAQNSVANGKITRQTPFKKVYIPSAGHDAGLSIGAALYVHHYQLRQPRQPAITHAFTGSRFSSESIKKILVDRNLEHKLLTDNTTLYHTVATCIAQGGVVGWFWGRSEFGPRALGHRSILADPRRPDAKDLLNKKIKRRESFRPFAPSVLKEYAGQFFEYCEESPFMERVFPIKPEKQSLIPAVTHVDGSGRLQTVCRKDNAEYYDLIEEFRKLTGIPILLNTSFNENEPIVNSPNEAIDCFLRTEMDMLVLENYLLTR